MTWYFDPSGTTVDIYDHTGALVAEDREFSGSWSDPPGYPQVVLEVMRESMDGNQPSAYNQTLLADAATGNIEEGTPP
jgi:hypothetical protein